jgi:hypothetical protein
MKLPRQFQRRSGSAILVVVLLLAIVLIYVGVNMFTLNHLQREIRLIEHQQPEISKCFPLGDIQSHSAFWDFPGDALHLLVATHTLLSRPGVEPRIALFDGGIRAGNSRAGRYRRSDWDGERGDSARGIQ